MIQSVRFPKENWTPDKARRWLKRHYLKPIKKVDISPSFYRYRIEEPNNYKSFSTVVLNDDIQLVIGYNSPFR